MKFLISNKLKNNFGLNNNVEKEEFLKNIRKDNLTISDIHQLESLYADIIRETKGKGLKLLPHNQMLRKFSILLAQDKAKNYSKIL